MYMCYKNWNRPVANKYRICKQCGEFIHKLAIILPPNYISDNVHQLGGSHCSVCDDCCLHST